MRNKREGTQRGNKGWGGSRQDNNLKEQRRKGRGSEGSTRDWGKSERKSGRNATVDDSAVAVHYTGTAVVYEVTKRKGGKCAVVWP